MHDEKALQQATVNEAALDLVGKLRKDFNLTISEISIMSGVTYASIVGILKGESDMSSAEMIRIRGLWMKKRYGSS